MKKKKLVLAVIVMAGGVLGPIALAGGPLGPPKAYVGQGKWLVDFEYAREETDMKACGIATVGIDSDPTGGAFLTWSSLADRFKIRDVSSNLFFASLAYGLCDTWDVYVRLGMANAKDDAAQYNTGAEYSFDGSYGFAWGVGTRATICERGPWSFGAVSQVTWVNPDDDKVSYGFPPEPGVTSDVIDGEIELNWRQFQVGLGVTYQADGWWVYGGPCWFFVNGDFDFDATETTVEGDGDIWTDYMKGSFDLREESEFGGWIGVGCQLAQATTGYAEVQLYGDAWVVGVGVAIPLSSE